MNTDVCISIPETAYSSLSDLIFETRKNGWHQCIHTGISANCRTEGIIPGIRIHAATAKELTASIRSADKNTIIIADAGDNSFNRFAITQARVSFLSGLENLPKNGFDHITAKLAADNHVGLVIELADIIDNRTRKNALKNYADILNLQRKYRFFLVIASGAKTSAGIRNLQETVALCSLFGMTRAETYTAMSAPESILHPKPAVEVENI